MSDIIVKVTDVDTQAQVGPTNRSVPVENIPSRRPIVKHLVSRALARRCALPAHTRSGYTTPGTPSPPRFWFADPGCNTLTLPRDDAWLH
eukprot:7721785-Pyramimonas_sp.AAC.1